MNSITASRITSEKVASAYATHVLRTYGPAPMALVRGAGSYVWDAENRKYLDFTSGIAVNTLGHCHPQWCAAIERQAKQLGHVSNLFGIPGQAVLAERLCGYAGEGKVFFCNSGAEANEFLIKLARLHGRRRAGGEEGTIFEVITAENSFHGRTFGGMSATPQAKVQNGFAPLLPGFAHAEFNSVDAFEAAITPATSAIMIETVQGEGGIHPATTRFLRGIRELCDRHDLLLLIDEVQCGIGRTGRFFAYQHAGIQPDAIGMAKGLGGGFPIGADWVQETFADLFQPGSHGTTYGGNPMACAAANAVLDVMEEENLVEQVELLSLPWRTSLERLRDRHPEIVAGVRGVGFHTALVLKDDPLPWIGRLRNNGLLTVRGGTDAIRLMPPLTVQSQELEASVEIIDFVMGTNQ